MWRSKLKSLKLTERWHTTAEELRDYFIRPQEA
jgi:hypothetical protein